MFPVFPAGSESCAQLKNSVNRLWARLFPVFPVSNRARVFGAVTTGAALYITPLLGTLGTVGTSSEIHKLEEVATGNETRNNREQGGKGHDVNKQRPW